MLLARFIIPFVSFFIVVIFYWLLNLTIIVNGSKKINNIDTGNINFIRIVNETKIEKKHRIKKKIPKKQEIRKIQKNITNINDSRNILKNTKLNIDIPNINMPINISSNNFLSGAILGERIMSDSEAVPILRIPPTYPRRAVMLKKEGFVKLKLFISENGNVYKAEVVDSKPKKIFDKAALNSVYGWRFKPKILGGKPIKQNAIQIVEFKLK